MPLARTFSITELAREFEVTTRTIRHYEEQGLLNPAREGTSRIFSNRDRVRLKLALRGK
ncbi:MAG TPA: MerR family transcriptional regulator, partial [Burkholderiales bacterium]|nr:MerR family transcriptional regulator [Burkholderiales bacterium]